MAQPFKMCFTYRDGEHMAPIRALSNLDICGVLIAGGRIPDGHSESDIRIEAAYRLMAPTAVASTAADNFVKMVAGLDDEQQLEKSGCEDVTSDCIDSLNRLIGMARSMVAFGEAIACGRLSDDPGSPIYAGLYMHMGPRRDGKGQAFKHVHTREYLP